MVRNLLAAFALASPSFAIAQVPSQVPATPPVNPGDPKQAPKAVPVPPKEAPRAEVPAVKPPAGWVEASPKLTTYSVWFPDDGKVKDSERSTITKEGQIRSFVSALERKDGAVYVVAQLNLPPKLAINSTPKIRSDFLRDMALEEFEGKVIEDKRPEMPGLPGAREILIQTKNEKTLVRMRIGGPGTQIYRLIVIGTKDQVNSKDAEAFYDCFRRVSRIKAEPPKEAPKDK